MIKLKNPFYVTLCHHAVHKHLILPETSLRQPAVVAILTTGIGQSSHIGTSSTVCGGSALSSSLETKKVVQKSAKTTTTKKYKRVAFSRLEARTRDLLGDKQTLYQLVQCS
jgi:hypothetical protein